MEACDESIAGLVARVCQFQIAGQGLEALALDAIRDPLSWRVACLDFARLGVAFSFIKHNLRWKDD